MRIIKPPPGKEVIVTLENHVPAHPKAGEAGAGIISREEVGNGK